MTECSSGYTNDARWRMLMTTFVRRPDTPQTILVLMVHTATHKELTQLALALLVNQDVTAQQEVNKRPLTIVLQAFIALLGPLSRSLWKTWPLGLNQINGIFLIILPVDLVTTVQRVSIAQQDQCMLLIAQRECIVHIE